MVDERLWFSAGSCTGQCTATYDVASGDQRSVDIEMQPNQAGSFTVESQMEWWFGNDVSTLDGKTVSLPLTVLGQTTATQRNAATRGIVAPVAVAPTSAPPPPPVVPASESGGGCNSISDPAGPASLALMGLLILPAVGLVGRNILPRLPLRRPTKASISSLDARTDRHSKQKTKQGTILSYRNGSACGAGDTAGVHFSGHTGS